MRAARTNYLFYKMVNGLTAEYLQSLIPPIVQNTITYNLRNLNDLSSVHARTNLFLQVIHSINDTCLYDPSDEIEAAPSIASFKYRLNNNLKDFQNITILVLVLARSYMQDLEWNAVP